MPTSDPSSASPVPKIGWHRLQAYAVIGLFILAFFAVLYFARDYFLPLTLAVLLAFLLQPVMRFLRRARLPRAFAAILVVVGLLGAIGGVGYLLFEPALEWMEKAPTSLRQIERKVRQIQQPVEQVTEAAAKVDEMTDVGKKTQKVEIQEPGMADTILAGAGRMIATLAVMTILLYFLLATGDDFVDRLVRVLPGRKAVARMLAISKAIEKQVSTYLMTVTSVNLVLGAVEALAMYLLGMPNPLLWGAMACLLNFVPYLGAMTGTAVIALVALLTFDSLGWALLTTGVYYAITAIEGGVITPTIHGRNLTLSPLAVFISLMIWGGLWGIPGAILAVPMMATFRILCEHIEPLHPVAELLGN